MIPLRHAYSVGSTFMALNFTIKSFKALKSVKVCWYLGLSASSFPRPVAKQKQYNNNYNSLNAFIVFGSGNINNLIRFKSCGAEEDKLNQIAKIST